MIPIPPLKHELQYRALGLVQGVIQPVGQQYAQGILVTPDGEEYPVTPGRAPLLKKFSHCMETRLPYWFYVQPQPRPNTLGLSVIRVMTLPEEQAEAEGVYDEEFSPAPADVEEGFNIRGLIEPGSGSVTVTVRRKPLGDKQFQPLVVKLQGFLPGATAGEFWDLLAERDGHDLLVVDGTRLS